MTVVSDTKTIFCEGKPGGLDYRLLGRIVENFAERPTIVAAGSKFTFSVFARGYFFPDEVGSQQYIVFRDRDFDREPTEDTKLLELKNARGKVFALLTHKTCVENYLLNANLIDRYWMSKHGEKQKENPTSKWVHGKSPGVEAITAWIESSARALKDYQAVRWALGDLLRISAPAEKLKTTWTGGSGKLPSSLTLQECETEAKNLIHRFAEAVAPVTLANFETSLLKYQERFKQENFWQNQDYLIWFQGKDLQKMMHRQQPGYISLNDDFFDWAIAQLDIDQYPDLIELRERLDRLPG